MLWGAANWNDPGNMVPVKMCCQGLRADSQCPIADAVAQGLHKDGPLPLRSLGVWGWTPQLYPVGIILRKLYKVNLAEFLDACMDISA